MPRTEGKLRIPTPRDFQPASSDGDKSPVTFCQALSRERAKRKLPTLGKLTFQLNGVVSNFPPASESQTAKRVDRVAWLRACFKKARQTYASLRSGDRDRKVVTLAKHALQAIRHGVRQTLLTAKFVEALMEGLAEKERREKAAAEERRLEMLRNSSRKDPDKLEDSWMQLKEETFSRLSVCNESAGDVRDMVAVLVTKMETTSTLFNSGSEITATCNQLRDALQILSSRSSDNDALLGSVSSDMSSSIVAARNMAAKLQADLAKVRRSSQDMQDIIKPIMDMLQGIESEMVRADRLTGRRRSSIVHEASANTQGSRRMSLLELEQSIAEGIRRSSHRLSKRSSLIFQEVDVKDPHIEGKLGEVAQPRLQLNILEDRYGGVTSMEDTVNTPDERIVHAKSPIPVRESSFIHELPKAARSRPVQNDDCFEVVPETVLPTEAAFLPVLSISSTDSSASSVLDAKRLLPRSNLRIDTPQSSPKVGSVFESVFEPSKSTFSACSEEVSSFQAVFLAQSQRHAPVSNALRKMKKAIVRQSAVFQERSRKQYGIQPIGMIIKPRKQYIPWFV